jgi:hypothetical protein
MPSTKREIKMKRLLNYLEDKAESFLWYIAKGDEALQHELKTHGHRKIIMDAVSISAFCLALLALIVNW